MQVVIMLAIGGAAGAASFTHVHNVAAAHGQGGWLAWADAVVLELMSIASGLEMRRRKRQHKSVVFPAAVLVCAVALSISAQVVEAEQSVIGWIAAALPAVGFLVMVKIALGRAAVETQTSDGAALVRRVVAARNALVPEKIGGSEDLPASGMPQRTRAAGGHDDGPASESPVPDSALRSRTGGSGGPDRSANRPQSGLFDPAEVTDVVHVLGAAAAARDKLLDQGLPLTRKALTEQLRRNGHALSNSRASLLVKILKAEVSVEDPSA
nr:DUF2637 domain-containing protein [Phytohabitans suffuscus]